MAEQGPRLTIARAEILPALLMLLAASGVCSFIVLGKSISEHIGAGVFNATYEFLLVAVLGSGVSVLFQAGSHVRAARERREKLQREIHLALVTGYNDAKRARRLLRARARTRRGETYIIDPSEYERQLEALSSAQLSIELATRRIELNRSAFPESGELLRALHAVCEYLNSVVDEWEDIRSQSCDSHATLHMAQLPRLEAFLLHYQQSPEFRDGFKIPFDTVLILLERGLAGDS